MIYWAIKTALESNEFERIVVSTDDSEVAAIAIECGAEAPFTRSKELSDDFASTISVVADAIRQIRGQREFRVTCCLYPTSIFATTEDLTGAKRLLEGNPLVHYVASVLRYPHPIQRALKIGVHGELTFVDPSQSALRTQDLEPRFHDAGQFYMGRTESWLSGVPVLENAIGIELPSWRVIDVDTEDDCRRAQELHLSQARDRENRSMSEDRQEASATDERRPGRSAS
jgi:N-acylneuraminate cytidylyltransferase